MQGINGCIVGGLKKELENKMGLVWIRKVRNLWFNLALYVVHLQIMRLKKEVTGLYDDNTDHDITQMGSKKGNIVCCTEIAKSTRRDDDVVFGEKEVGLGMKGKMMMVHRGCARPGSSLPLSSNARTCIGDLGAVVRKRQTAGKDSNSRNTAFVGRSPVPVVSGGRAEETFGERWPVAVRVRQLRALILIWDFEWQRGWEFKINEVGHLLEIGVCSCQFKGPLALDRFTCIGKFRHEVPQALDRSKFIKKIAKFTFPPRLKMSTNVGKYDGLGDPDDHLAIFVGAAEVEQWSQRKSMKDPTELHNIKRGESESLGDFITRFSKESMQVKGAGETLRISAFIHGVKNDQLVERFHENLPGTVEEMLERAKAFVRGKKACEQLRDRTPKKHAQPGWNPSKGQGERRWLKPHFQPRFVPREPFQPRFGTSRKPAIDTEVKLPSLTKTPSEILATENVKFTKPTPLRPGPRKNMDKYCEFHKENGHATDDCFSLRRQIESAIKMGKLSHLIKELQKVPQVGEKRKEIFMLHPLRPTVTLKRPRGVCSIKRNSDHLEPWMEQEMSFPPIKGGNFASNPLTISAIIAGHHVHRVYVDTGSASEIMYEHCFLQLDEAIQRSLVRCTHGLTGFSGEVVQPIGQIQLPVVVGNDEGQREITMTFIVIRAQSSYNVILGRPGLCLLGAIVSTIHSAIKFPTPGGVVTLRSNKECRTVEAITSARNEVRESIRMTQEKWVLHPSFPDQKITVGGQLDEETKNKLRDLLMNNLDMFAWQPADMSGVPRSHTEHQLKTYSSREPVAQKRRYMGQERSRAVIDEVQKLLEAGIVREVRYQTWVANPVMVKKGDGSWRMCINYKDLNKACPKDCYPLPEIDLKIDSLASFPLKCFLDAYKGYHQVQMAPEDEDKTAFYTDAGIFCFTKMPFGLKNAGATYQRLMDRTFRDQIGRNLEVYVDDIVIKSKNEEVLLQDINETFATLRSINMKLNPKKCSFGVDEGKFLGVMVTKDGLQANPEKVEAVMKMPSPKSLKEVQTLNGRLVALNRFLAKHAERALPFISTLKNCLGKKNFNWTAEAESAFQEMKKYLGNLPTLVAPSVGEKLTMYLSAGDKAISAVLMTDREGTQTPIYFVSRALKDPETRYSPMEKLALSLVHASRRLRRYFQAHEIEVQTEHPIQQVLRCPEISGRLAKWAIELGAFDIKYRPRSAVKGQVIADFISEIPCETGAPEEKKRKETWNLHTDGASNDEGSGAGLILVGPDQLETTYALKLDFKSSNNEAEYEALLAGLRLAHRMKVNGTYDAKEPAMKLYLEAAKNLISKFEECEVLHVPRSKNKKADALSKLASTTFGHLANQVRVEVLEEPSISQKEVNIAEAMSEPNWMTHIVRFLTDGSLPDDKAEARKTQSQALQYELVEGVLYRRSYLGPLLRCLTPEEANYVIREIHMGICGIHAGPRMVVGKAKGAGYYWSGMHQAAAEEIGNGIVVRSMRPYRIEQKMT
ncbi:hypothetical protein E3N88_01451 [Mikania micrantha]|uniref:Reverse transcriptase domain-containing protein n=1 Tax=Mikania micrantha TaxID=192012 RepID=A0A5N6Q102_9ASTR|nr:hypothetical protein E3N88_01451 [Mikania micrantha]